MTEIYNKKEMKPIRRLLRKQNVPAERVLWQKIRRKQLGFRFLRQFSIGRFVVDFYCPEKKIAIEIDGVTHCTDIEISKDLVKENYIKNLGLELFRFKNSEIYNDMGLVLDFLHKRLNK
jgi:very-short-patch-repair endonuclease